MPGPLKLLFVIKAMGNPGGGAERVLADVANRLATRGHAVTLATTERPDTEPFYALDPAISRIGLAIGSSERPARGIETARRMTALRKAIRQIGPDVVVGFMHSSYVPLSVAMTGLAVPLVASEHNVPERYAGRRLQWALLKWAARRSAKVTAVSEQARALYPEAVARNMIVLPNPVALEAEKRADVGMPAGGHATALAVGRLHPQKDHATLIEAFGQVAGRHPNWRLRILGDGPLRPALEAQIARLGLTARVELAGTVRDVSEAFQQAQLFVVPSRFESLGLSTVEAMVHGLPAIGFSDCPGTNTIIANDHNGLLVDAAPEDRAGSLADALDRMMGDTNLRKRLAGNARALGAAPDPERVTSAWEAMLGQVARGRPR